MFSAMESVTSMLHLSNTTTKENYDLIPDNSKSWIAAIYYSIIFLVGIPGNALIIRVYTHRKFKSSTHVLILGLAVVDITVCLLRPLMLYYRYYTDEDGSLPRNILGTFELLAVALSAFLTSAIAFDRYDAACNPHERIMTRQKASYVIALGVIFSIFINSFYIVERFTKVNDYISSIKNFLLLSLYILSLFSTTFFYSRVYQVVKKSTSAKTKWKKVLTIQCIRALQQAAAAQENGDNTNPLLSRQNAQSNLVQDLPSNDPPTNHLRVQYPSELFQLSSRSRSNETLTTSTPETRSPVHPKKLFPADEASMRGERNDDSPSRSPDHNDFSPRRFQDRNIVSASRSPDHNVVSLNRSPDRTDASPNRSPGRDDVSPRRSRNRIAPSTPETATPCNSPIMIKLSAGNAHDKRFHSKVTRMLLLAAIVFFLSWLPCILLTVTGLIMKFTNCEQVEIIFEKTITAFETLYINSMVNPWIYSIANEKFRQECKRVIRELFCDSGLCRICSRQATQI